MASVPNVGVNVSPPITAFWMFHPDVSNQTLISLTFKVLSVATTEVAAPSVGTIWNLINSSDSAISSPMAILPPLIVASCQLAPLLPTAYCNLRPFAVRSAIVNPVGTNTLGVWVFESVSNVIPSIISWRVLFARTFSFLVSLNSFRELLSKSTPTSPDFPPYVFSTYFPVFESNNA